MTEITLKELPKETVSLINSGQIITSVNSAVKELIENSLDAEASSIEVRLDNYGLNKISVKDDGCGVKKEDISLMVKAHFTSKISSFNDLNALHSYGFRGEALSALAAVSSLSIMSKTKADLTATTVAFDHLGQPLEATSIAATQGTTIVASNLFGNLPVRRAYHQKGSRAKEDLKRVENTVTAFAVICPSLRIALYHNNKQIFVKSKASGIEQSIAATFGQKQLNLLDKLQDTNFQMWIPKEGPSECVKMDRRTFVFVNSRPVHDKKIEKLLKDHLKPCSKPHVVIVSLDLPTDELDVNLDPNKYSVFFAKQTEVLQRLQIAIDQNYEEKVSEDNQFSSKTSHQKNVENVEKTRSIFDISSNESNLVEASSVPAKNPCNIPRAQHGSNNDCKQPFVSRLTDSEPERSWGRGNLVTSDQRLVSPVQLMKEATNNSTLNCSEIQNGGGDNVPSKRPDISEKSGKPKSIFDISFSESQLSGQPDVASTQKPVNQENSVFEEKASSSGEKKRSSESDSNPFSIKVTDSEPERSWARGNLKTNENRVITPVQLLKQPPITSSLDVSSEFKKRDIEEDAVKPASAKKARIDKSTPKIDQVFAASPLVKDKQKAREGVGNATLERMVALEPKLEQTISRPSTRIKFSLTKLKTAPRATQKPVNGVIGQLKTSGFWLCLKDGGLRIINHHRLQEVAIFNKLMESYSFTAVNGLHPSVDLSKRPSWNAKLNQTLFGLESQESKVVDRRVVANGIDVSLKDDTAELKAVWDNSEIAGVEEFVKIIQAISVNQNVSVANSRPLKMKRFLEGEAIRMQRQTPPSVSRLEVERLIQLSNLNAIEQCLHGKPVFSDQLFQI